MIFSYCPRCGEKTYEYLATHSYCVGCNYSPTLDEKYDYAIPPWALEVLKEGGLLDDGVLLPHEFSKPMVGFVPREKAKETMPHIPSENGSNPTLSEAI